MNRSCSHILARKTHDKWVFDYDKIGIVHYIINRMSLTFINAIKRHTHNICRSANILGPKNRVYHNLGWL